MMNFSANIVYNLKSTYLGHIDYEGADNWGDYLYLELDPEEITNEVKKELRNHILYVTEFDGEESRFFVYKLTDKQKITIVMPFLSGKYSQIDREYVAKYFPKYTRQGTISNNWRILVKDEWERPDYIPSLRQYWEDKIGCNLPEDAELWSRPMKRDEVYNYEVFELLSQSELILA